MADLHADQVEWLYEVWQPVNSRSDYAIQSAIRQAFSVVLMRVSGLKTLPDTETIREAASRANRTVLQRRFEFKTTDSPPASEQLHVVIEFDRDEINRLMYQLDLPLWSADRPSVLMWLTHDNGEDVERISANQTNQLVQSIRARAKERGIDMELPRWDIEDMRIVAPTEILSVPWVSVESASKIYAKDIVIASSIEPLLVDESMFQISIRTRGREVETYARGGEIGPVMIEIIDKIVDDIAAKFAVTDNETASLAISVSGIDSIRDYFSLDRYLLDWEFIESLQLVHIKGSTLRLIVHTASPMDKFLLHIERHQQLVPITDENGNLVTSRHGEVEFDWIGTPQ